MPKYQLPTLFFCLFDMRNTIPNPIFRRGARCRKSAAALAMAKSATLQCSAVVGHAMGMSGTQASAQ